MVKIVTHIFRSSRSAYGNVYVYNTCLKGKKQSSRETLEKKKKKKKKKKKIGKGKYLFLWIFVAKSFLDFFQAVTIRSLLLFLHEKERRKRKKEIQTIILLRNQASNWVHANRALSFFLLLLLFKNDSSNDGDTIPNM